MPLKKKNGKYQITNELVELFLKYKLEHELHDDDDEIAFDLEDGGKNITKKVNKQYKKLYKAYTNLIEQYSSGELKIDKDITIKQSLKQVGWDRGENKIATLAEW